RRREVGLGGEGQGHLRPDGWPPLRGGDLPPDGRRLLRPDPTLRRGGRLPAGPGQGPHGRRRAAAAAEDRPRLRARPEARRRLPGVGGPGQHLRPGHALVREAQERPRGHRHGAGHGGEEPLRERGLSPPAGAGPEATGEAGAGQGDLRGRRPGLRGLSGEVSPQQAGLRGAVLRRGVPVQLVAVRQGGEELRRHPRYRSRRQVQEGSGLRVGAGLDQADRAGAEGQEAGGLPGAAEQGPTGGGEGRADRPGSGGEVAPQRHRSVPLPLPQGSPGPRRGLPRGGDALRPQPVPRGPLPVRGHHPHLPQERGGQVRHQPHRGELPHRQGLAERGGGLGPAGPEHRRHRPQERPLQGPGQVQARRAVQAGRRADGPGPVGLRGAEVHRPGRRGTEARVRRQGAEQRRGLLREGAPLRERAQALRAHLPRVPQQQAGRRRAVPGGGQPGELLRLRERGASHEAVGNDYPASKDREAALYNAARLQEGQQQYKAAAASYARYATLFPKAEDAPKNQYRAALVYEKDGDSKNEVKALQEFIRKFGNKPGHSELLVEAQKKLGDAYAKSGSPKDARRAWETAAKEFDKRGLKAEQAQSGADAAAEARFLVAEQDLKEFDKLKIGGRGKGPEKSVAGERGAVKKVQDSYAEVFKYKQVEWSLAAAYRRGYVLERFGATINETPVPPDVKRLGNDAVTAYQDLLQQQTAALEDKAVESYAATLA